MKAVVILLDSLNRHALPIYGYDWARTPAIERLAARSVVFENHWLGSAPCMPARRDMMTGRLNFLERQWGGLEPYEYPRCLAQVLQKNGVFCHMETDHYHYWYGGGEDYCQGFTTFNWHRGQESDRWTSRVDAIEPSGSYLGRWNEFHRANRTRLATDADYPSPRTFQGATDWLEANQGADNWFMWIEAFDPHEPFDTPEQALADYDDTYEGPEFLWHKYGPVEDTPGSTEHLRKRYAATLSQTDRWMGRFFDEMDRQNLWEDTLVILTTDHGHFVGERGVLGKNIFHVYNELAHIPLVVHAPGDCCGGQTRNRLSQNIDLYPTVLEHFGIKVDHAVHGRSLWPVISEDAANGRDYALYGWHGAAVNVTDGRHTYFRSPAAADNSPLYAYGLMPTQFHGSWTPEILGKLESGRFLPHADCPVWRYRCTGRRHDWLDHNELYDLETDYSQHNNLAAAAGDKPDETERAMMDLVRRALKDHDSPPEQFVRLGLQGEL